MILESDASATVAVVSRRAEQTIRSTWPASLTGRVIPWNGDLVEEKDLMRGATKGATIVHAAGIPDVSGYLKDPRGHRDLDLSGTHNVLDACILEKPARIVTISSARVYGRSSENIELTEDHSLRPVEPYGATKAACESIVRGYSEAHGIDYCILRPFSIYGPPRIPRPASSSGVVGTYLERCLDTRPLPVYGEGNQTKDFIYIDDFCRAVLLAATVKLDKDRVFNIATGVATTVMEVAALAKEVSKSNSRIERKPPVPESVSNRASTSLARRVLGFSATTTLRDGMARYLAWMSHPQIRSQLLQKP